MRDQLNENTAFIDGSLVRKKCLNLAPFQIYSSEAVTLRSLRTGPMLKSVVSIIIFSVYMHKFLGSE